MFARDLYRCSLLGRFIDVLHTVARLHGKRLDGIVSARNASEQRALYERIIAPLFDYKSVKLLSKTLISLYALGIPPNQYRELMAASNGNPPAVCASRWKNWLAIFPFAKIISPGRSSRAATMWRTAKRCLLI